MEGADVDAAAQSSKVRRCSEEGAVTRFLRATEIDTRMLGMVAALLLIWVRLRHLQRHAAPAATACSAARS